MSWWWVRYSSRRKALSAIPDKHEYVFREKRAVSRPHLSWGAAALSHDIRVSQKRSHFARMKRPGAFAACFHMVLSLTEHMIWRMTHTNGTIFAIVRTFWSCFHDAHPLAFRSCYIKLHQYACVCLHGSTFELKPKQNVMFYALHAVLNGILLAYVTKHSCNLWRTLKFKLSS